MGFPIEIALGLGGLFFALGIFMFIGWFIVEGIVRIYVRACRRKDKDITQELPTVDGTLRPITKR